MNFKEYIKADIDITFINNDEFAETVNINGVEVSVVEDSDKLEQRIKSDYQGLIIGDVLFYISADDYDKIPRVPKTPTSGIALNYGREHTTVVQVSEQSGIYEIILRKVGGY